MGPPGTVPNARMKPGRQTIEDALEAAKVIVGGLRELMRRGRISPALLRRPSTSGRWMNKLRSLSAALNGAFGALAYFMLLDSWDSWTWDSWHMVRLVAAAVAGGAVGWYWMADSDRGRKEAREAKAEALIHPSPAADDEEQAFLDALDEEIPPEEPPPAAEPPAEPSAPAGGRRQIDLDAALDQVFGAEPAPEQAGSGKKKATSAGAVLRVLRELQEATPDPNTRNREGRAPLHHAARRNDRAAIAALLEAGADPNEQDGVGRTPLQEVMGPYGYETYEPIYELLEGGADPIPENGNGDSLLSNDNQIGICFVDLLANWANHQWDQYERDMVNELERNGGWRDRTQEKTRRAVGLYEQLRERSERTHEQAMELVYGHLGPPQDRETPLHQMAYGNDAVAITLLLEAGANPNARDATGEAPLHWAVGAETLATLLDAGADPNARDDEGETPLYRAVDREDGAAVTALLNAGADPMDDSGELLHWAVDRSHGAVVTALLSAGADPNVQDEFGRTPLHYAAGLNATVEEILPIVAALLDAGADSYVQDWYCGWDPLQEANHNEFVEDNRGIVAAIGSSRRRNRLRNRED